VTDTASSPFGPADSAPNAERESEARTWRPLRFLNLYRFTLAALLILLHHLDRTPPPLGLADPALFYHTSLGYLGFSLLAMYPLSLRRPRFMLQLAGHILADVIFITLLMHASGGVASGVGMLLVVSVANGSMIAGGRAPLFFAALASIGILTEAGFTELTHTMAEVNYPLAGMLGITLFATAILAHVLARRARESEALARQRGVDLANMAQLTDYIIQHMQTGVMVVDPDNRVRLMNSAAWRLLGTPMTTSGAPLQHYCPPLRQQLQDWQQDPAHAARPLHIADSPIELLPQFMRIGQQRREGTLIFLEDAATTTRQAQQLKLASLGRLTASIAHEIRNPLGAISHAGALLEESPALDANDQRLTEIIREQSQRINIIIENVLQLGRRDRTQFEELALGPWLEQFVNELQQALPEARGAVALQVEPADIVIAFDPNHLHQILNNLCQNGLRHAQQSNEQNKLRLHAGLIGEEHGFLDIIDAGPGISEEHRGQIFEPFFTTESNGTGLGLYLARELAVCNQAQLRYEPSDSGESRFRLLFRIAKGVTPRT
jgi:two-component system sensor histidine kinase PilS (NtrC family)